MCWKVTFHLVAQRADFLVFIPSCRHKWALYFVGEFSTMLSANRVHTQRTPKIYVLVIYSETFFAHTRAWKKTLSFHRIFKSVSFLVMLDFEFARSRFWMFVFFHSHLFRQRIKKTMLFTERIHTHLYTWYSRTNR